MQKDTNSTIISRPEPPLLSKGRGVSVPYIDIKHWPYSLYILNSLLHLRVKTLLTVEKHNRQCL